MEKSRFARFDSLLTTANRSILRLKGMYMDKYQLSAAHTDCICRLAEHAHGLTQIELGALEGMDKAQVSRVLRTLAEKGLVCDAGAGEYRKRYTLTESGRAIAEEIESIILNINRFVSDEIADAEIETFYRVFEKIVGNLERAAALGSEKKHAFRREP